MRIISFIEDMSVIREILQHLGLWLVRSRPPPKIHTPSHYSNPKPLISMRILHINTPTPNEYIQSYLKKGVLERVV